MGSVARKVKRFQTKEERRDKRKQEITKTKIDAKTRDWYLWMTHNRGIVAICRFLARDWT